MAVLDIIIAIVLLFGAYRGFRKGFIYTIAITLAFIFGTIGSIQLAGKFSAWLSKTFYIHSAWLPFFSCLTVFILIIILVVLLAKVLEKFIKTATLGWLNKVAGIIFGVFKMAFFISVLFWLMQMVETKLPLLNETQKNTSVLYAPVARIAPAVLPVIKGGYKQLQDKIKEGSNF